MHCSTLGSYRRVVGMCGVCREPNCSSSCVEALENTLHLLSESLKESYASTRGDVVLEFGFRIRSLRSRGDDLIRELETECRQNLLIVERCLYCWTGNVLG